MPKPKQSSSSKVRQTRSGVSLLIAVMLIGVISYFATMTANTTITQTKQAANSNRSTEALYAAMSGLEEGLLENSEHGAGYSTTLTPTINGSTATAAVKIQGQVPVDAKYMSPSFYTNMYGAPTPGTGNVGKDCDPLKAFKSVGFWYSPTKTPHYVAGTNQPDSTYTNISEAADHPCNWNKIKIGETMSIPLYYSTTDVNSGCPEYPSNSGNYVCNLVKSPSDIFILRVRTPCDNGDEMCLAMDRYDFDVGNIDPIYGNNEPIMSWQITGVDQATNASLVLGPWIKINKLTKYLDLTATIIHELKLNGTNGNGTFEVLTETVQGEETDTKCLGPMLTYLLPNAPNACADGSNWSSTAIIKPVLKLSVIQSMTDVLQNKIPYLEYQFLSDFASGTPPTDTSQTITSEGFSGEFKATIEARKSQSSGLLEYVIQQ